MGFEHLSIRREYRSLLDNVVSEFYIPVLKEAVMYRRAVGFFSSSALVEISRGICGLIRNGGKIQLIASPKLSAEDIAAIRSGFERRHRIVEECLLRELREPVGQSAEERLNLLSNLIAADKLEIKIAFLEHHDSIGIFHEKMGLMYDNGNRIIAFTGSMNETATAFSHNYESIDVFGSWTGEEDRVLSKQGAFNAMWGGYEPHIRAIEFQQVTEEMLRRYRVDDALDLFIDEREYPSTTTLIGPLSCVQEGGAIRGPRIPRTVSLRPYQIDAIASWEQRGFRGIFDMATGTGKTYTALAAVERLYRYAHQRLGVIIVCPYQHLVEQWKDDIQLFGMKPIVCYSASPQRDWRERLQTAATSFSLGVQDHFCVISTNATFSGTFVQDQLRRVTGNLVLVVDEAHNFGAEHLREMLMPHIPYRLALSATIDRHGDEEGTQRLYDYFGEKCIEYTLKEAIDAGMLTPYFYHPIAVSLDDSELVEYLELTRRISRIVHTQGDGKHVWSEQAKALLIRRARLVASTAAKIPALMRVMSKYRDDSHMLVYCGATTMRDVGYEESLPPPEEVRQVDMVADLLGNKMGMRVSKFTSEEPASEREAIKGSFADGNHLQALVAIRCLDEGVNIPSIRTAFILASSTNPKEYIQRRGRVLRISPGKTVATIYDFVTLPIPLFSVDRHDDDAVQSVRSLAMREITRMRDFASISENPSAVDRLVSEMVTAYRIRRIDEGEGADV